MTLEAKSAPATATQVLTADANDAREEFWYIHGHAYDLRSFAKHHPGGEVAINLGRNRDCTALFESYHPFTEKHRRVLQHRRWQDC
mmetsp:Transcript_71471/g.126245  ORF Transcript_71471/g.126245 Transcript_71471/m.126245 type:complete len:86 (-) Transcript_71471:263-520(-)